MLIVVRMRRRRHVLDEMHGAPDAVERRIGTDEIAGLVLTHGGVVLVLRVGRRRAGAEREPRRGIGLRVVEVPERARCRHIFLLRPVADLGTVRREERVAENVDRPIRQAAMHDGVLVRARRGVTQQSCKQGQRAAPQRR